MSKTLVWTFAALVVAQSMGCAENEQTFFIEHVKVQPEAPECSVTPGDGVAFRGLLDVFFDNPYAAAVMVTNHAASRESYESGKAESNGIFIDYAESYVLVNGQLVGERAREPVDYYLEPESSDVVWVTMIPYGSLYGLQVPLNCNPKAPPSYSDALPAPAIAVVRLFGHTAGGTEVETQELSFAIDYCCGCLIDWSRCGADCAKYCDDELTSGGMCIAGIANGTDTLMDCRYYFDGCDCSTDD